MHRAGFLDELEKREGVEGLEFGEGHVKVPSEK
jgi:hypothetical protein